MSPYHGAGTLYKPRVSVVFAITGYHRMEYNLTLFITKAFISGSFQEHVSIEELSGCFGFH